MKWIKATDRLPEARGKEAKVVIRDREKGIIAYGFKNFDNEKPEIYYEYCGKSFLGNYGIEWLDDTAGKEAESQLSNDYLEWWKSLVLESIKAYPDDPHFAAKLIITPIEKHFTPPAVQTESQEEMWEGLFDDFLKFALSTFVDADSLSSLEKLDDEVKEVAHEIQHGHKDLAEEYADCMMCILDSAARMNIYPQDLRQAFAKKLTINKNRKWAKNENNTYSHIK